MSPRFKIGDKVHVLPDIETVYIVIEVKEGSYQFFYDVKELSGSVKLSDVPESQLEPAE